MSQKYSALLYGNSEVTWLLQYNNRLLLRKKDWFRLNRYLLN